MEANRLAQFRRGRFGADGAAKIWPDSGAKGWKDAGAFHPMANPKHLKILNKGVQVWNEWRSDGRNGGDLSEANLKRRDLRQADFHWAELGRADLFEADLSGANLSDANLHDANLRDANLVIANLSGAKLSGANLSGANLSGVNLKSAYLGGTFLLDLDLGSVEGLESIHHHRASLIDFRTLQKSWPLPEIFLRGCGLPDDYIKYLPSLVGQPIEFFSAFISYSHEDKSFARRLHDALQGRGIRCWLDEHQVLPGDDIYEAVDHGIRLWDKVLLCCSQASLASWWVDNEINSAFEKERTLMKQREGKKTLALIPLDLDGTLFDWENAKRKEITRRLAADFVGWDKDNAKFEAQLERVVKALRADGGGRVPPPQPRL